MSKYLLIISITAWVLISLLPILAPKAQKTEVEFNLGKELVITQGNSLLPIADPAGPEPKVVKKLPVVITAYSSTPWETDDNPYITAAGTWVKDGIIANNLFPFGTKVRIPEIYGDKVFIVEDRMSWKKGYYHFDIWFSSYWEAKNFGTKRTYIEILES